MNRFFTTRFIIFGMVLLFLAIGCSGGGNPTEPGIDKNAAEFTISLGESQIQGDELIVPVLIDGTADLNAMSFRIGFEHDGLVPLAVEWGLMLMEGDSMFYVLDRDGFVPLAFARMEGIRGIDGSGEFCRLRFRIRNHERRRIWIIDDPDYLVAYDSLKRRMRMRPGGGR